MKIHFVSAIGAALVASAASAAPGALGGSLQQLVNRWETGDPSLSPLLALHITSRAGDPVVLVRVADGVSPASVASELSAAGFRLTATSTIQPQILEGYLPLGSARAAAAIPGVQGVRAQFKPQRHAGSVQSQAVALQNADKVQANGIDGSGIRVGALSDTFDHCPPFNPKTGAGCTDHAADNVKSGDLSPVTVLDEGSDPGSDEGRAMLQLIHDVAPGAQLGFASAFNGEVQFANNMIALRTQFGADVVVDDVIYFDEPMYSDGIVAQAADIVSNLGGAYFSSAMNNGVEGYEAVYNPISFAAAQALVAAGKSNLKLDQIPANLRPKSFHNFLNADGSAALSNLYSTAGDDVIDFQWDEAFYMGKVKTDYNIYVFDAAGNFMDPDHSATVFYTHDDNTSPNVDSAIELAEVIPFPGEVHGGANTSDYQIVIGKMNDGPARHIKYVTINSLGVSARQGAPTTWGHAAARGAQGVAAMYYAIPNFPEDFSSPGPVAIWVNAQGNPMDSPQIRQVPQITAGDGVDTTFFGFDSDGNGVPNFFGTSAAAPDAAATAALVLQAAGGPGSLHPIEIYKTLQKTATPVPLANDRGWAAAFAGPVAFSAQGDWVRQHDYFGFAVQPFTNRTVKSITFDVTPVGLTFSGNRNRFNVGTHNGVSQADITQSGLGTQKWTLNFAPGSFGAGDSFRFGMSVFAPIQGSTQEDPDRFRGAQIIVTLDDGSTFTGTVFAAPQEPINRFTGFGLVNAAAAVQRVQHGN